MARFDYFEPRQTSEVIELLSKYGDEARVIAGGQSLLIMIRQELVRPKVLISLDKISSLSQIKLDGNGLELGAMVTQSQLAAEPNIRSAFSVLAQAASRVGSVHVQNLGTVGGIVSHAEPNGDSAPALLSLGASVQALSSRGERYIPLENFFRGPFENVLEPDEFLTQIRVPFPEDGAFSVYLKHVLRGVDRAIVGVGVMITVESGGVCEDVRIGLCGAAPTPIRAKEAEALLRGKKIVDSLLEAAGDEVSSHCDPLSDGHGPADYKKKMAALFVKRAIREILGRRRSKPQG